MVTLSVLYLCLILISQTYSITYESLNKTSPIVVQTYADQAAQNIRAIARSYMHRLILDQKFSDYLMTVYDKYKEKDHSIPEVTSWYAKTYWAHTGAVGIGLVVAVLLFFSIFFLWICCCCCNKTQKTTRGMSCWRMTWGVLALLLIALNIAGIVIGAISMQNMSTMEAKTNNTIDTLSDGMVKYLKHTEGQIEQVQHGPFSQLIDELRPLVVDIISTSVNTIVNNDTLITSKNGIVDTLNSLDTTVKAASSAVSSLLGNITSLEDTLTGLNTNITQCENAVTTCKNTETDIGVKAACVAVDTSQFTTFNISTLQKTKIEKANTTIVDISVIDGRTLSQWSQNVTDIWNDVHTTVNNTAKSIIEEYDSMIDTVQKQVDDAIKDTVTPNIDKITTTIKNQSEEAKEQLKNNQDFYMAMLLSKEIKAEDYPHVDKGLIENKGMIAPGLIFITALIGVLLLLLLLNILCGIGGIILGCCKVSDDVPPTDRDSGTCGTLLMCTSYCSVFLCAVATLVAAIILTIVLAQEGVCREYSKSTLLDSIQKMDTKYGWFSISEKVQDATDIKIDSLQIIMDGCEAEQTVITVLNLEKSSVIFGNNITDLQEKLLDKISEDEIISKIDSVDFTIDILDNNTRDTLNNNKDNLSPINYTDTAKELDNSNTGISNLPTLITALEAIKDDGSASATTKANVGTCVTSLKALSTTTNGEIDVIKSNVKTTMLSMQPIVDTATSGIVYLIDNATALTDNMFGNDYVKNVIKSAVIGEVNEAKADLVGFIDYIFRQLKTTVGSCQPVYALYATVFNYTCDGYFIHLALIWSSLSLIGISLLFYMCISRCLARYFIKFPDIHPADETLSTTNIIKNDWNNGYEMSSPMSNRVGTTVTRF